MIIFHSLRVLINPLNPMPHMCMTLGVYATALWHVRVTLVHGNSYYNTHISDMLLEVCKASNIERANAV